MHGAPEREKDKKIESLQARLANQNDPGVFSREEVAALFAAYQDLGKRMDRIVKISDSYQYELKALTDELHQTLDNIRILKGLIPICAACKKIHGSDGIWKPIEQYIYENSDADFTHGLCPDCATNYANLYSAPEDKEGAVQRFPRNISDLDLENPVISHNISILNNKHFDQSPLRGELLRLLEKYILLEKRQRRIVRISDKYQYEIKEIKEKFEQEARIDYLTGLANRREMYQVLQTEIARATRHGSTLSLILFDFDNFKNINDMHGHEAGDMVLRHGAKLFEEIFRQEDTCARWGGEEFVVVQPQGCRDGVLSSAERLRKVIEQNPLSYNGAALRTTISLGVALYSPGDSVEELVLRADTSLYSAKKQGKNQVGPLVDKVSGMQ